MAHHDYVDLGLPSGTLWATCNVGADEPTDYGDFFAWGETAPKENYIWGTYKFCNGSNSTLTKYCTNSSYGNEGFTDGLTTLEPADDAAAANWGGGWRMPTVPEWQELNNDNYCTWTWYGDYNGVAGYKVESKIPGYEGRFIFLPAAGYKSSATNLYAGSTGTYLSSALNESDPRNVYYCTFGSGGRGANATQQRYCGRSVRPVKSPAE